MHIFSGFVRRNQLIHVVENLGIQIFRPKHTHKKTHILYKCVQSLVILWYWDFLWSYHHSDQILNTKNDKRYLHKLVNVKHFSEGCNYSWNSQLLVGGRRAHVLLNLQRIVFLPLVFLLRNKNTFYRSPYFFT